MKKIFVLLFVLTFSLPLYAIEVFKSGDPVNLKIDAVEPSTVEIRIPQMKYFKVSRVKLVLSDIHQDLSDQYMLKISNEKKGSEESEKMMGKTWAIQEVVAPDESFELNKVEIRMDRPKERGQELLICDESLYEKTRGVLEYDSDKNECFAILDPSMQIQKEEHFFIVVKLMETPISVKKGSEENLLAFHTDYPDGFKERDPFPDYLNRDLVKSKNSLIYKIYSKQTSDVKPTFRVNLKDVFDPFWTWQSEEKAVLDGAEIVDAINIYIKDNWRNFENEKEINLPIVFQSEASTYPILLKLTSWEIDIKAFLDYINELKFGIDKIFRKDEKLRESFVKQLQEITDAFKEDDIEGLKEKVKSFIDDLYAQHELSLDKREEAKEIDDMMILARDMQSLFVEN